MSPGVTDPPSRGRRLRIAHTNNALLWNGTGHTNSTLELALEHAAQGHRVTMICSQSDARTRSLAESHGVTVVDGMQTGLLGLWRSARKVAPLLRDQDVVHLHTLRTTVLTLLAAPRQSLRRTVGTLHNPHQLSAWLMCTATRIVTLNEADRRSVRRLTLGLRRPRVINNGMVGVRRLPAPADVTPEPLPPASVVFVGALHPRKGLDVLLRAIGLVRERVPEVRLYVVGNRDAPDMEQLASDVGVDDVTTFVGFSDDPRRYMLSAAVFVLPSRVEGFGNVLVEARSCGTPIVASDVGGIPEALSGGRAGRLVPPGSATELADALADVLTNPREAQRLREATAVGLDQFSVRRAAAEYTEVYRSVAPRDRSHRVRSPEEAH